MNSGGKQDEFYFERSNLLVNKSPNDLAYQKLYEKIPVVFLLGWAGSQDIHVRKYEQLYAQMGYHTIRFAPSNQLTFFKSSQHKFYADRLLSILDQYKLTNNTFITHLFR